MADTTVNLTASNAPSNAPIAVSSTQPSTAALPELIVRLQNEPWYQSASRETQQAAMAQLIADPSSYDQIMAKLVSDKITEEQSRFNDCVQKYVVGRFDATAIRGISNFATLESMIRTGMGNCLKEAEKKTFPDT